MAGLGAVQGAGEAPSRAGHTCVAVRAVLLFGADAREDDVALLLFGGCDTRGPFGELFQYRLDESVGSAGWAILDTPGPSQPPARRSNHVAVCFGERTFVFGGFDGSQFLADLHAVGAAGAAHK